MRNFRFLVFFNSACLFEDLFNVNCSVYSTIYAEFRSVGSVQVIFYRLEDIAARCEAFLADFRLFHVQNVEE